MSGWTKTLVRHACSSHRQDQGDLAITKIHNGAAAALSSPADNGAWGGPDATQGADASSLAQSDSGLDMLKLFEGLQLDSYEDSAGVRTIGYGHTGSDVQPGQHISGPQAETLLRSDTGWAEQAVRDNVDVPLSQQQFDALTSFTYNVGEGAFEGSTLLARLNSGDYDGAQSEFGNWVNAGGQPLEGLVNRREAEAAMFGGDGPQDAPTSSVAGRANGGATGRSGLSGASGSSSGHEVRDGDTLSAIAERYGVSLDALLAANPQITDPDLIFAGQRISLPAQG
jgi:GH24 family phage-related lysozyme (muramidase)